LVYTLNVGSSWQTGWLRLQGLSTGVILAYLGIVASAGRPWPLAIILSVIGALCGYIRTNKQHSYGAAVALRSAAVVIVGQRYAIALLFPSTDHVDAAGIFR
jgi:hypothetical protein